MGGAQDYELELEKIASGIKREKAKIVCIQLPAGLKPKAGEIQDFLQCKTGAEIIIWGGSCFGACDLPNLSGTKVGLLVQWGHSEIF
jgi:2-(3-amino-3-carboxypropyl)histidine synthase